MATEREIKKLLKEMDDPLYYDKIWRDCLKIGVPKIQRLEDSGIKWSELPVITIKNLPKIYADWEKQLKEAEEFINTMTREVEAKREEEYRCEHFDECVLSDMRKGIELSEEDIRTLACECNEVDVIEGDDHRWQREMTTIVKLTDTDQTDYYVAVNWMKGLTEYQENSFYDQPYFVKKEVKLIEVTNWVSM